MKLPLYNNRLHEVRFKDQTIDQKFSVRLTGLIIRLFKFHFSLNIGIYFLSVSYLLIKLLPFNTYISYLVKINSFYFKTNRALMTGDSIGFVNLKQNWCDFVIGSNIDRKEVRTAEKYIQLIRSGGGRLSHNPIINVSDRTNYYIYGPNSQSLPRNIKDDCIVIFVKPPKFDISYINKKWLFLNQYSLSALKKSDCDNLTEQFDKCFVFSNAINSIEGITDLSMSLGAAVGSDMALNRILDYLIEKGSLGKVVIDGFDFYTKPSLYAGKMITGIDLENLENAESQVARTITFHDPLFNFLRSKELIGSIQLERSDALEDLLNLSYFEYLDLLISVRRFDLLART